MLPSPALRLPCPHVLWLPEEPLSWWPHAARSEQPETSWPSRWAGAERHLGWYGGCRGGPDHVAHRDVPHLADMTRRCKPRKEQPPRCLNRCGCPPRLVAPPQALTALGRRRWASGTTVPWVPHCCWPRWGQGGSRDEPAANQATWVVVVVFTGGECGHPCPPGANGSSRHPGHHNLTCDIKAAEVRARCK